MNTFELFLEVDRTRARVNEISQELDQVRLELRQAIYMHQMAIRQVESCRIDGDPVGMQFAQRYINELNQRVIGPALYSEARLEVLLKEFQEKLEFNEFLLENFAIDYDIIDKMTAENILAMEKTQARINQVTQELDEVWLELRRAGDELQIAIDVEEACRIAGDLFGMKLAELHMILLDQFIVEPALRNETRLEMLLQELKDKLAFHQFVLNPSDFSIDYDNIDDDVTRMIEQIIGQNSEVTQEVTGEITGISTNETNGDTNGDIDVDESTFEMIEIPLDFDMANGTTLDLTREVIDQNVTRESYAEVSRYIAEW